MDAKTTMKIKDMICQKMEEIARTNTLSNSDIEKLNMLIVGYEKLLKTEEMEGISEYSQGRYSRGGNWTADGSYDNGGNSYGMHYVNGHYSRADAADMTRDHIQRMMSDRNMSSDDRRVLERAMNLL